MEGLIRYQAFTTRAQNNNKWIMILVVVYAVIFGYGLSTYLQWQSVNLLLGVACLCICTRVNSYNTGSRRFGYIAFALLFMVYFMPVKTILYIAVLSGIIYLVESYYGKLNHLPLLTLLLMSPFFQYLSNIFLFPIRMQLSSWAGGLLLLTGQEVNVMGNIIIVGRQEFSVDPACMGLNMMVVSLLLAIMLIGVYQKKLSGQISLLHVLVILLFTFVMNMVANLFRILVLVQFDIEPGHVMHNVAGIACLAVYVFIPLTIVTKYIVKRGRNICCKKLANRPVKIMPHLVLAAFHLLLMFKVIAVAPGKNAVENTGYQKSGYTVTSLPDDVVKLNHHKALVYIKPIQHFYNADHNPMICWKGSGYTLERINTTVVAGIEVYTATLVKDKDLLYTAWWYDNGIDNTISQMQWRWNMLLGNLPYALVNVTTAQLADLDQEVARMLDVMKK